VWKTSVTSSKKVNAHLRAVRLARVHTQRRLYDVGAGHDLPAHRDGDARAHDGLIGWATDLHSKVSQFLESNVIVHG
jgi:hypothetical protein